jgi:mRNA interferase RelE/StbE
VYDLELIPEARDDLKELDKTVAQRILNKLHWLTENFDALTPEPLTGDWSGLFKLRIGDYRAL